MSVVAPVEPAIALRAQHTHVHVMSQQVRRSRAARLTTLGQAAALRVVFMTEAGQERRSGTHAGRAAVPIAVELAGLDLAALHARGVRQRRDVAVEHEHPATEAVGVVLFARLVLALLEECNPDASNTWRGLR